LFEQKNLTKNQEMMKNRSIINKKLLIILALLWDKST